MKLYCKKTLAFLLAVLLLTVLFGCGAKNSAASDYRPDYESYAPAESAAEEPAMPEAEPVPAPASPTDLAGQSLAEANAEEAPSARPSLAEKIIYSGYQSIETTEFDKALAALDARVKEVGGFIEASDVNGRTQYREDGTTALVDRYAHYVIRVPCARFEEFMRRSGEIGNVLSSNTSAQNITSQFTDTEARRDSLRVQEERLLAMMEKTDDMESLITLESRLSEVRYEIESLERQLIDWQNRVDYSGVTVELREVAVYTPVEPVTRTFGERLGSAFADGWRSFVRFVQGALIVLARVLPTLVLLAVLALAVVLLVRLLRRRRKGRQEVLHALNRPVNVAVPVEKKDETE